MKAATRLDEKHEKKKNVPLGRDIVNDSRNVLERRRGRMATRKGKTSVTKEAKGQIHSGTFIVGFAAGVGFLWIFEEYQRQKTADAQAANTIIMALPLETLKYAQIGDLGALASINSSAARTRADERMKRQ